MNLSKKLCSLFLAILLVLGTCGAAVAVDAPLIRVVDAETNPGGTVDVAVELVNNPGIVAAIIQITYDKNLLTLQTVTDGGLLGTGTMTPGGDKTAVPYKVLWTDSLAQSNHTGNGTLVTFTFVVKEDAAFGETAIGLSVVGSCYNSSLSTVAVNGQGGKLTITDPNYHEHSYTPVVTAPTCTEGGYTTYTCACGDSYTADTTLATGHSFSAKVTAPTCTAKGYTTNTCSKCGYSYKSDEKDMIAHTYKAAVTAPTCTAKGYTTYTCSVCKDTYTGNETDMIAHDYKAAVTAPTCTAKGYTTYTCSVCKDTYTGNETDMIAHTYTSVVVPATCTAKGYTSHVCTVCKHSYNDNETDMVSHKYLPMITAPTCTEDGYTTYTCSVCKDTYTGNTVVAKGHSFGTWYVVTEATVEHAGQERRDCSACTGFETKVIPALPGISIQNYVPTRTENYRTTITFTAVASNFVPDENNIRWFVDGKEAGRGKTFKVELKNKRYDISVQYLQDGQEPLQSETETVMVKTGFFQKLSAFFKALFKKLPTIVQEYVGLEKI